MAGLQLSSVTKSYGPVKVIHGIDLDIEDGDFVVFVGPSGCGKSTLLRMISGLEETTSGKIEIGERDVTFAEPADRGVAMVFQTYALYPHMTVKENMGFGLKMNGHSQSEIQDRVGKAADILELTNLLDRKPKQLSGGQRQRVAIGRSIVREPDVFLFDEPLSNLDAELRVAMRIEIAKLHQELGSTMIYVTHDQVEAMTLADKIVVLRSGVIEQQGAPLDLYDDPDNLFIAGFIGSPQMNFLSGKVTGKSDNSVEVTTNFWPNTPFNVPVTSSADIPEDVTIGIRPEHFEKTKDSVDVDIEIDVIEHLGGESYIYSKKKNGEAVIVQTREGRSMTSGAGSKIDLNQDRLFLFDTKTTQRVGRD